MSKPDDIPQNVWDAAEGARQRWAEGPSTIKEAVARAIMAERQRWLEAAAPFAKASTVIDPNLSNSTLLFAHFPSLFGGQTEIRLGDLRELGRLTGLAAPALPAEQ